MHRVLIVVSRAEHKIVISLLVTFILYSLPLHLGIVSNEVTSNDLICPFIFTFPPYVAFLNTFADSPPPPQLGFSRIFSEERSSKVAMGWEQRSAPFRVIMSLKRRVRENGRVVRPKPNMLIIKGCKTAWKWSLWRGRGTCWKIREIRTIPRLNYRKHFPHLWLSTRTLPVSNIWGKYSPISFYQEDDSLKNAKATIHCVLIRRDYRVFIYNGEVFLFTVFLLEKFGSLAIEIWIPNLFGCLKVQLSLLQAIVAEQTGSQFLQKTSQIRHETKAVIYL